MSDNGERERLSAVVRDLLARLDVTVQTTSTTSIDLRSIVERPSDPEPALARVWVDMTSSDHATLYIVDEPWERVLVRKVPRDRAEIVREEIGHIIETAVEAMLHGARIGLERKALLPDPEPAQKPVAIVRPRSPLPALRVADESPSIRFHASLFEQMTFFSKETLLVHSFGIGGSLESRSAFHPGVWLGVAYRWPSWTHAGAIGVKLEAFEARMLARASLFANNTWSLYASAGPGIDITTVTPIADHPSAKVTRPSADASFMVRASLSLRWKVLMVSAAFDVDTLVRDYPFEQSGQTVIALSPFRVRPSLILEALVF